MYFISKPELDYCIELNTDIEIQKHQVLDFTYYSTSEVFKNFDGLKILLSKIPVFPDDGINSNIFYNQPMPNNLNQTITKIVLSILSKFYSNENDCIKLNSSECVLYQHGQINTNIIKTMPMVDSLHSNYFNSNIGLNVKGGDGFQMWKIKENWNYNYYSHRYNCFLKSEYGNYMPDLHTWKNFENVREYPDIQKFVHIKSENNILKLYPSNAWYTPTYNEDPEFLHWSIISRYKFE